MTNREKFSSIISTILQIPQDRVTDELSPDEIDTWDSLNHISLIGALGFSIVLPFLVFLIEDFGGNAFVYGLVGATYPLFQFVGAPVLGRWSDRMGRRRVLLISQLGTLASWVLFAIALYLPVTEITEVSLPVVGDFTLTVPLLVVFIARAVDGLT